MTVSEERKGQIALIILKRDIKSKQIYLNPQDLKRKIGSAAKELKDEGVTKEEMLSMYEEFVREAVDEMFAGVKE